MRRDSDIAVRMVRPSQGGLVARSVGASRIGLFAHRRYLAGFGDPRWLGDHRGDPRRRLRPRQPLLSGAGDSAVAWGATISRSAPTKTLPSSPRYAPELVSAAARTRSPVAFPNSSGCCEDHPVRDGGLGRHARGSQGDAPRAAAVRPPCGGIGALRQGTFVIQVRASRPWHSRRRAACASSWCRAARVPEVVRDRADRHGDHENDHRRRQRRQVFDRRSRTQSDQAPADAEQRRADDQRAIDHRLRRPLVLCFEKRRAPPGESVAEAGHRKRRRHHYGKDLGPNCRSGSPRRRGSPRPCPAGSCRR